MLKLPFLTQRRKEGADFFHWKQEEDKKGEKVETQLLDHVTSFISGFMLFLKSSFFYILKYFTRKDLLIV